MTMMLLHVNLKCKLRIRGVTTHLMIITYDASSYVPQTRISHQGASHTFHNLNIRHSLLMALLHMCLKRELRARGVPTKFTFILEIMISA